jgi:signal recognition particle subunit SRP54
MHWRYSLFVFAQGDWSGFMNKIQDVIPEDKQPELIDTIAKGQFSMRILYEQFSNILKMGPMSQVMSLIPGFSNALMPKGAPPP